MITDQGRGPHVYSRWEVGPHSLAGWHAALPLLSTERCAGAVLTAHKAEGNLCATTEASLCGHDLAKHNPTDDFLLASSHAARLYLWSGGWGGGGGRLAGDGT
jgi:hypothetical protein